MTPAEAQSMLECLAESYGSPVPDLYVTEDIPSGYVGVFLIDDWSVRILPKALNPKVVGHEYGHSLYHWLYPGACQGMGSPGYEQCEAFARNMERMVNGMPSPESLAFILGPIALGLALLFR